MTKQLIIFFLLIYLFGTTSIYANDIMVSYISAEHIYVNAGTSEDLNVGTVLAVKRDGRNIATLEVVYAAKHSASCKIISKTSDIRNGDFVEIMSSDTQKVDDPIGAVAVRKNITEVEQTNSSPDNSSRFRGYVALQWYSFHDNTQKKYDYSQPAILTKFKGENLFGSSLFLNIRMRSRHYQRSGRSPGDEWQNRIYNFNISYQDPASPVSISLGRIISGNFSGTGYIDGLLLTHSLTSNWHWGLFGGFKPDYRTSQIQTEEKKYGAFLSYLTGDYSTFRLQASIAVTGEYHDSTINREFLYIQTSIQQNRLWNLYYSMELDVNRGWRKERSGKNVTLSSLYLSGLWNINNQVSTQVSFDNRENYYTYDYYSLADSLFDDAFRQGLRLSIYYRPQKNVRLFINGGLRKRENEVHTTHSFGGGFNLYRLFFKQLSLNGRISVFSNIYTEGFTYSVQMSQRIYSTHTISVLYGAQLYQLKLNETRYKNRWIRLNYQTDLLFNIYFSTFYEYNYGDDKKGHYIFAEIGYRL